MIVVYSGLMVFFLMPFERRKVANICSRYEAEEWHVNEHSGYPQISMDVQAVYAMIGEWYSFFFWPVGVCLKW